MRRRYGSQRLGRGMTLVEVLVVMAIMGGLMGLVLPAMQNSREASRAAICKQNLKQIGLASHAFHGAFRSFPPARIVPRPGDASQHACGGQEPTWFVHLLPFLEEPAADRWQVYEPYAAHPEQLRAMPVSAYVCPTRRSVGDAAAGVRPSIASRGSTGRQPQLAMMMLWTFIKTGCWVYPGYVASWVLRLGKLILSLYQGMMGDYDDDWDLGTAVGYKVVNTSDDME